MLMQHEIIGEVVAPDWPSFVRKSALRADSFLARLSDTEFDQGMPALRAHGRRDLLLQNDAATHPLRRLPLDRRPAGRHQCYLAEHNASPKPFVWTQSADAVLAKIDRLNVLSV